MDYFRRFTFLFAAPVFEADDLEGLRFNQIVAEIERSGFEVVRARKLEDAEIAVQTDAAIGCMVVDWGKKGLEGKTAALINLMRRRGLDFPIILLIRRKRFEDLPVEVLDFIDGDYTFVNPVLAAHYGMPVPKNAGGADGWARVDEAHRYERGGLLPMAVFLTQNAPGLRTSPVKRGHWFVTRVLGEHIPAPPPNVPAIPTDETKLGNLTLRETLARHREDKTCASCHAKFDSFGLVFEGFGPIGDVRTKDLAGRAVETSAVFPDGSEGSGLAGLRAYFHARVQGEFLDNLDRKLMVYALGRSLQPSDDFALAAMHQKLSAHGYRFGDIVESIVTSRQFLTKRARREQEAVAVQVSSNP